MEYCATSSSYAYDRTVFIINVIVIILLSTRVCIQMPKLVMKIASSSLLTQMLYTYICFSLFIYIMHTTVPHSKCIGHNNYAYLGRSLHK